MANDPINVLSELLGYDPAINMESVAPTKDVFQAVMDEVKKDHDKEVKAQLRILVDQAIAKAKIIAKLKDDFAKQLKREESALIKFVKRIEAKSRGETIEDEPERSE
jgi:hypothetical protein